MVAVSSASHTGRLLASTISLFIPSVATPLPLFIAGLRGIYLIEGGTEALLGGGVGVDVVDLVHGALAGRCRVHFAAELASLLMASQMLGSTTREAIRHN